MRQLPHVSPLGPHVDEFPKKRTQQVEMFASLATACRRTGRAIASLVKEASGIRPGIAPLLQMYGHDRSGIGELSKTGWVDRKWVLSYPKSVARTQN